MKCFDNSKGVRRRINLRNMREDDVHFYVSQFLDIDDHERKQKERELRRNISKKSFCWTLAIETKSGDIVGIVCVKETAPLCALVTVEFPNNGLLTLTYGEEAIDQFLKICREDRSFYEVELEEGNPIIERYKRKRSIRGKIIKIA